MRGDGKDKHKVCLRASTPYIRIWPDLPSRSRTLSIPSFSHICMSAFVHTICSNWVRPCCRMFSQRKEMAAICISGSASRNPLNPATHTHIPHTHWNTCSYANSKPNYKFASWPHIKTFNSIWKAFYYSNFGQRSLRVCPFASCPYICPSGGLSVCVCLGKSLVRDTCA